MCYTNLQDSQLKRRKSVEVVVEYCMLVLVLCLLPLTSQSESKVKLAVSCSTRAITQLCTREHFN